MLCTVISDSYTTDEREEVATALNALLAHESPDWSRRGVYAYWDRESHDILYLGLANDLPTRFAQHNGLVSHGGGNKTREINSYFSQKSYLGFTIVVQGAAVAIHDLLTELDFTLGIRSDELIAVGEGQLIETHRLVHGKRPPWNETGGSRQGQRMATAAPALLDILAARQRSLFVARRNLRDLACESAAQAYEAAIHASRMRATMDAHEVGHLPDDEEARIQTIKRSLMLSAGHLLEELDASDDSIVGWLHKLGDTAYWKREADENRRGLEELRGEPLRGHEREVADILEAVFSQATPPEHIAATEAVFQTGYLRHEPRLAA